MAQARKPHRPPLAGQIRPPTNERPGYVHGADAIAGFGVRAFYVAQLPRRDAVEIIRSRHYSGTVVGSSYVHLGVYVAGELLGALQFGYALNPRRADKVVAGTAVDQYLELNRMWLDDRAPRNSESRAISYAIKYIRRACPGVRWIQSYADERCGGLGVVYQACNFLYLGCHTTLFYELDGDFYHKLLVTAVSRGALGPCTSARICTAPGGCTCASFATFISSSRGAESTCACRCSRTPSPAARPVVGTPRHPAGASQVRPLVAAPLPAVAARIVAAGETFDGRFNGRYTGLDGFPRARRRRNLTESDGIRLLS